MAATSKVHHNNETAFLLLNTAYISQNSLVVIRRERFCERIVGAQTPEYIIVRDVTIGIARRFWIPIVFPFVKW